MCFSESVSTRYLPSVNCLSVTKGLTVASNGTNFGKLFQKKYMDKFPKKIYGQISKKNILTNKAGYSLDEVWCGAG